MFTSAFMFYCSSWAGAKFGFGEVEKWDSKRDWFSWTTPCCEVLKCSSRCCTCILCCPVKYDPNLAFLSVLEKFLVLGDRWRCVNAWCDSILDVADGCDALGQQQLFQPGGSQAFAAFWHLVVLNSRDSSSEKCSSERGKTIKSRNVFEGRVVQRMDRECSVTRIQC